MRWSLDSIYKSFDCEEFNRDYKLLLKEAKEAKLWCEQTLSLNLFVYFASLFFLLT